MKANVNEAGVSYLKSLAGELLTGSKTIKQLAANLKDSFDENKAGLGPHDVSISAVIEAVNRTMAQCEEETLVLAGNILGVAHTFQAIIDNDPYGSGASGGREYSGGSAGASGVGSEAASISDTARQRINDYEDYFSGVCAKFDARINAISSNPALSDNEKAKRLWVLKGDMQQAKADHDQVIRDIIDEDEGNRRSVKKLGRPMMR